MALTPLDVDQLTDSVKKLLELWMRTKLVITRAFSTEAITRDHETAFLQLKSDISRIYRGASSRLPSGLKFEGDKMIELLKNAMTMEHLSNQPPIEKQAIFQRWYTVYIRMTRTFGALEVMKAGYYPAVHRGRLKSATETKSSKKIRPLG